MFLPLPAFLLLSIYVFSLFAFYFLCLFPYLSSIISHHIFTCIYFLCCLLSLSPFLSCFFDVLFVSNFWFLVYHAMQFMLNDSFNSWFYFSCIFIQSLILFISSINTFTFPSFLSPSSSYLGLIRRTNLSTILTVKWHSIFGGKNALAWP